MELRELKRNNDLIIVGGGPSKKDVPFHLTQQYDIWSVGAAVPELHKYSDVIFEMHHDIWSKDFGLWQNNSSGKYRYMKDLNDSGKPVCMCYPTKQTPESFSYPKDEIIAKFGNFFNNTISYMIAAAILLEYKKIYFYGVDMKDEKYLGQKPCCNYYLGYAVGRGIEIFIHEESDLLKGEDLYGYTDNVPKNIGSRIVGRVRAEVVA